MIQRIRYVNLLLLLLLCLFSVFLIRSYLLYRHASQVTTPAKYKRTVLPAEHRLNRYSPIIEDALFPTATTKLTPIDMVDHGAPGGKVYDNKRANALTLLGIVVGLDGYAIFENKASGKEDLFQVGDDVFGAGVLKEVGEKEAVLDVGGRLVPFQLPRDDMRRYAPSAADSGLSPQVKARGAPPAAPGSAPRFSRQVSKNEWVIDQRAVLKSLDDMSQVLTDARITPRMAGGEVEGFVITEIKPRGIFDALGLKNGDVLMRVNNYDIVSPERAIQVLSGLKGANEVNIDLIRGGQNMSFHYQIR